MKIRSAIVLVICLTILLCNTAAWAGSITAWGSDSGGKCSPPSPNSDYVAISAGADHSLAVRSDGTIAAWGSNAYDVCDAPDYNGFVAVSAGRYHSMGLQSDGSVRCWGDNAEGQCDPPTLDYNFIAISAGARHSLALRSDGSVAAWGYNGNGEGTPPFSNTDFVAISAGAFYNLALKSDGSIAAWGQNANHQCEVPFPNTGFVAIAAGYYHSLGLKSDGSIVAWGSSGLCSVPYPNSGFTAIAAGYCCSAGMKSDGSIVIWGNDSYGQSTIPSPNTGFASVSLGDDHCLALRKSSQTGSLRVSFDPTEAISSGLQWRRIGTTTWRNHGDTESGIAEGSYHVEIRNTTVWIGPKTQAVVVSADQTSELIIALKQESIAAWGQNSSGVCDVPPPNMDYIAIAAGYTHSLGIQSGGVVLGWGQSSQGQCFPPGDNTNFTAVAAGGTGTGPFGGFSVGLKSDGSLEAWGTNINGQCNVPSGTDFTAIATGQSFSLALRSDGSVVGWGQNDYNQCNAPDGEYTAIAAGPYYGLALRSDGTIAAWGQPGLVITNVPSDDGFVGIAAASGVALGLKSDGSIVPWGSGALQAIPLPNTGFTSISARGFTAIGLKSGGSVVAWGMGLAGKSLPYPNAGFVAVSAGNAYVMALRSGASATQFGSIRVTIGPSEAVTAGAQWRLAGSNIWFNSGETENDIPAGECRIEFKNLPGWTKPATQTLTVSANATTDASGSYTATGMLLVGILPDLVCDDTGNKSAWRLVGTTEWHSSYDSYISNIPVGEYQIEFKKTPGWRKPKTRTITIRPGMTTSTTGTYHGGSIVAWGDNSFGQHNVPSPNAEFVAIAGGSHSLGLKSDGSVVAWGRNNFGQCNVPSPNSGFVSIAGAGDHSLGLKSDGSVVAWGRNDTGQCNVPSPNSGFVAIAGGGHSLGLKSDGSVVAWGYNNYGQCNIPSPNSGFRAIASGNYHSLGLKSDGSVVAWGWNYYGQCNVPSPNSGFVSVAGDNVGSIGLRSDGSIAVWGCNEHGEFNVPSPNSDFVSAVMGSAHSLGLKSDGSIVAWEWNSHGQCNVPSPNSGFAAIASSSATSFGLKLTDTGSLRVIIQPAAAVYYGAKWRRVGMETWLESGEVEYDVPVGAYNIEFSDLPKWVKPADQAITITADQTCEATGTYIAAGLLTVTIMPDEAMYLGAWWRRVGTSQWLGSGETEDCLSPGDCSVEFSTVPGWRTPQTRTVTIASGKTTTATGTYHKSSVVLADSVADFSFSQGYRGWYYGYWPYGGGFHLFTQTGYDDNPSYGAMWYGGTYCRLWAQGGHPDISTFAVRRWVSSIDTEATISGHIWKMAGANAGNGVYTSVNVNQSAILYTRTIAYNDNTGVTFSLNTHLTPGCPVDFVIGSNGEIACDQTGFTAVITVPVSTGSLRVSILPPSAVAAGAKWRRVGTEEWLNSGTEYDVPIGSYTVEFSDVAGLTKPVNRTVSITANHLSEVSGTYWGLGSLSVTIEPSDVIGAGAKWRRVGTSVWFSSGDTESNVLEGSYKVEFSEVAGWAKPVPQAVTVTQNQTYGIICTYVPAKSLKVNIEPALAVYLGGQWRRVGTIAWLSSGETESVPAGEYDIEFKNIQGWREPMTRTLTVSDDNTTETTGTYHGGTVAAWGWNGYGQCNVPSPNSEFVAIAGGMIHSLGLRSDGSVVVWGYNEYGQCNVPSPNSGFVAITGGGGHSLGLKSNGSVVAWGYNEYGQCNVPSPNSGFLAVASGGSHSLGLKSDGSFMTWGYNGKGQCNVPSPNSGFVSGAACNVGSIGLRSDGSIAVWGCNEHGEYNVPSPNSGFVSVANGYYHALGLKSDGSIVAWGSNGDGQCSVPSPNSDFVAIASNSVHSLGLKSDGSIVAWGDNYCGQCNVPSPNSGFAAIAAGDGHSIALKLIEIGGLRVTIQPSAAVAAGAKWRRVGTSQWFGSNETEYDIPVGNYSVEFSDVVGRVKPAVQSVSIVSGQICQASGTYTGTGALHVIILPSEAITAGAKWKRIGTEKWFESDETENELPAGSYSVEFADVTGWIKPAIRSVSITSDTTSQTTGVYTATGSLHVIIQPSEAIAAGAKWRRIGTENWFESGETEHDIPAGGYGVEFSYVPEWATPEIQQVVIMQNQTCEASGTYAPAGYVRVNILPSLAARQVGQWRLVGTADWHNDGQVAIVPVGDCTIEFKRLQGWREPMTRTLTISLGNMTETTGTYHGGSVAAWGSNSNGQSDLPVPNSEFVSVSGGQLHSLGLRSDGSIIGWGDNSYGQCNVPTPGSDFVSVSCGAYHSLGLRSDGSVVAWGDNSLGQCYVEFPFDFVSVSCGAFHSLGLKSYSFITVWGSSSNGQNNVPYPNFDFTSLAGGYYHSLGLRSDSTIAAWGDNTLGQCNVPSDNWGFVSVASGWNHSLGLKYNNSIVAWGDNMYEQCNVPSENGFTSIAGGGNHSLGLKYDGSVVAWGDNSSGQCNVSSPNSGFSFTAAGYTHSLAIRLIDIGALSVTIQPIEAATAGAKWRRVGTSQWFSSGETEYDIPVGEYDIEFSETSGWVRPPLNTTVAKDQITPCTATFVQARTLANIKTSPGDVLFGAVGIVSAEWDNVFYIETPSRSSGIRVEMQSHGLDVGSMVDVIGNAGTTGDGECFINALSAVTTGSGSVKPIALVNRAVGGGDMIDPLTSLGQEHVVGGFGLNNIGLLIRTWGKIVDVEPVISPALPSWIKIDDGSGVQVKCVIPSGVNVDSNWKYISVTGISSCEKIGPDLYRLILIHKPDDIECY